VTFNKINTYQYYADKVYDLQAENHPVDNFDQAFAKAREWGPKIPLGLFYQNNRESYDDELAQEKGKSIISRPMVKRKLDQLIKEFI